MAPSAPGWRPTQRRPPIHRPTCRPRAARPVDFRGDPMTRDADRPTIGPSGPATPDEAIGALIRAVTDDWRMPPQRLDEPTWRDRVEERAGRRQRGWFVRLAGPAATAVVATVLVAFVAVWLT